MSRGVLGVPASASPTRWLSPKIRVLSVLQLSVRALFLSDIACPPLYPEMQGNTSQVLSRPPFPPGEGHSLGRPVPLLDLVSNRFFGAYTFPTIFYPRSSFLREGFFPTLGSLYHCLFFVLSGTAIAPNFALALGAANALLFFLARRCPPSQRRHPPPPLVIWIPPLRWLVEHCPLPSAFESAPGLSSSAGLFSYPSVSKDTILSTPTSFQLAKALPHHFFCFPFEGRFSWLGIVQLVLLHLRKF